MDAKRVTETQNVFYHMHPLTPLEYINGLYAKRATKLQNASINSLHACIVLEVCYLPFTFVHQNIIDAFIIYIHICWLSQLQTFFDIT